jgi:hypothetical protein
MIFQPYHAAISLGLNEISERGARNGCPFCLARLKKELASGDEIVLLHGYSSAGKFLKIDSWSSKGNGWLCIDLENVGDLGYFHLSPYSNLFLKTPLPQKPTWSLSLSVEDNLMIDDVLMRICASSQDISSPSFETINLERLAAFCWVHRIPFDTKELLEFLVAHGLPSKHKQEAAYCLDVARATLINTNGKRPIKRRKMLPFSQYRYWPKYK